MTLRKVGASLESAPVRATSAAFLIPVRTGRRGRGDSRADSSQGARALPSAAQQAFAVLGA